MPCFMAARGGLTEISGQTMYLHGCDWTMQLKMLGYIQCPFIFFV